jgi:hypothetical protein
MKLLTREHQKLADVLVKSERRLVRSWRVAYYSADIWNVAKQVGHGFTHYHVNLRLRPFAMKLIEQRQRQNKISEAVVRLCDENTIDTC